MTRHLTPPHNWFHHLWRTSAPLAATAVGMTAVLALSVIGLWLDPRTIGGAPAWLKPAKFAASLAIVSRQVVEIGSHHP